MSPDERRCPDGDCEHNDGGRCVSPAVAAMGLAAGTSAMQAGMPFMTPFGASMVALPFALNEDGDGLGIWNNCPRHREKSVKD